jgi:hypothetical protein
MKEFGNTVFRFMNEWMKTYRLSAYFIKRAASVPSRFPYRWWPTRSISRKIEPTLLPIAKICIAKTNQSIRTIYLPCGKKLHRNFSNVQVFSDAYKLLFKYPTISSQFCSDQVLELLQFVRMVSLKKISSTKIDDWHDSNWAQFARCMIWAN